MRIGHIFKSCEGPLGAVWACFGSTLDMVGLRFEYALDADHVRVEIIIIIHDI